MKQVSFRLLVVAILAVLFVSCSWLDSTDSDPSVDPSFLSLTFAEDDSIEGLEDAEFTVEFDNSLGSDSVIVNLDSLPFKTDITKVIPTFTFISSAVTYVYLKAENSTDNAITDTVILTGTDTLNFERVVKLKNIAEDQVTERTYFVKVNVHKVDPDLYVWKKAADDIYSQSMSNQKAIFFNDKFYLYLTSGLKNYVYTSTDAKSWEDKTASLVNLPINISGTLRNIQEFAGKLYILTEDHKLYTSSNGLNWTAVSENMTAANYQFKNLLYAFRGKLWALVNSTNTSDYYFATTEDGSTWATNNAIPASFPVADFISLSFFSKTNQPKVLLAGGVDKDGKALQNVWSSENGSYWVDFNIENTTLDTLAGASVIAYDDRLLLVSGRYNKSKNELNTLYLESLDDGLSWSEPDTTYNYLREQHINIVNDEPDTTYTYYEPRIYQSVVQRSIVYPKYTDYYIYLIGGYNPYIKKIYKDVWVGKLNRLSFIEIED
ncbi:MAG: hypothetical protein H6Q20_302 [Bacteroidetes bacterium]|nr:hypothetical protein [Bacteroidota bacterium]